MICPIDSQLSICTGKEAFNWEKFIISDDFAIQFCATTPGACSDERLWNADSCHNDYNEWQAFFLQPTIKFQLMENIKNSLGSMRDNGMDENTWRQEVLYIFVEMTIATIARNNNAENVCNLFSKK